MKKSYLPLAVLTAASLFIANNYANAQAEPDFDSAVNQLNFFQQECFKNFPNLEAIRNDAINQSWVVGPLNHEKPVSWAANYGPENYSIMITDSNSISSKTCEVRGKASFNTVASVFDGLYKEKLSAIRTGAPESSWKTPKGLITIQPSNDGRTSVILAK